eukprot:Phypoly_transcript_04141.p1 GENE.Phypoly_transcript_04141~~Phypoly_transcript_04141.p1  ORF type:complete len:651 (+),score=103.28 Phypoly_transcript_04141:233-1954(+)
MTLKKGRIDSMSHYCVMQKRAQGGDGGSFFLTLLNDANVEVKDLSKITYYINKALVSFHKLQEQLQLDLIQQLAEVSVHASPEDATAVLPSIHDVLIQHIPPPPSPPRSRLQEPTEPKLNFSIIEATLYIFHVLASKATESFKGMGESKVQDALFGNRKKALDSKLQYLEERTKKYIQMMELTYNSFANSAVLSPEGLHKKNIISIALKSTNNVLLLAQNLLHKHPEFSSAFMNNITLSSKVQKDSTTNKQAKEKDKRESEKRKRYKEEEEDTKTDVQTQYKREKTDESVTHGKHAHNFSANTPINILPPASPMSPQGSPVIASIEDLPQVWRGSLGKGDAAICRIFAKQIEGAPLNDNLMQLLKGNSILAVKDRTPIGDLAQYLNQGKLTRLSVFYFQPQHESDKRPFVEFIQYLKSKDRAGITRLSLNKIMYMVPTSPLATLLLSLIPNGCGSTLLGKEDLLLGVMETDVDKPTPIGLNVTNMNSMTFPVMHFPNMLNMANMGNIPNFGIPNMAMMNMASTASEKNPGVTSPKLLQNIATVPNATPQANINFPSVPNFPNMPNFPSMLPVK